ncbi:hypothetical protein M529_01190 [Sphingobium ummariense RL-3]|uniref:Uncharacterized protein n=1 Tax=Sphingobium ummariense RL-3 TaxID=1346791 RepID=T0JAU6_9SPHN|nr:hypothetical protein M529_01190 [Sphingobium ummariense RL-3]
MGTMMGRVRGIAGGMDQSQHLYRFKGHAIDEDMVGVDNGFARSGFTTGAVHIGMVGQVIRRMHDGIAQPDCGVGRRWAI